MILDDNDILRYSRQIILKEVGGKGQEKLFNAKVLIVGAGGLGSPAGLYLAASGIGTVGIIDGDNVDLTNLQRQIIHFSSDLNKAKVESAEEKIKAINPKINVIKYKERLNAENIASTIKDFDFIIDGTDNFPAKFLINDACVLLKKPFSHAGILRFDGQTFTHIPGGACYRCIFPELPPKGVIPSCSEAGILGPVAGIIGSVQALETIKFILGIGNLLINRLFIMNAFEMNFRIVNFKKNKECPICGENPSIKEIKEYEQPVCELKRN
ncbi:MAG: HesA/MoeB/ThiF family protein [Candidatus Omnitrophica bacterium]|nr:HesA/MoeB/ThiF family protein [Candidatus Omnitrophota bacterium]